MRGEDDIPALVLRDQDGYSGPFCVLKVFRVRPENTDCRVGIKNSVPWATSGRAEILLTPPQLRELAADLRARADLIDPPAELTHDELLEAIRLCRVVCTSDDSNGKGSALADLHMLLDRFPPTTTAAPTAETGA